MEHKHFKKLKHVAIIMDGNGRWAAKRLLPRIAGHRAGSKAVRRAIDYSVQHQIPVLSLFALSVENFLSRPTREVQFLITLFTSSLKKNLQEMHDNHIRIRFIGDLTVFSESVQQQARDAESLTKNNNGLTLVIAINYSGRWDILQAAQKFSQYVITKHLSPTECTEKEFASFLCTQDLPEPDLLIRTSGEQRISNFMLWQLAYTELCFVKQCWPDFDEHVFSRVIDDFYQRERRFGMVV